jgi:hypothetical protein
MGIYKLKAVENQYILTELRNKYTLCQIEPFIWDDIKHLFSFLWVGGISGNYLYSITDNRRMTIIGKDFSDDYIPSTSLATFTMPNDADYVADDLDNFWFTAGVSNIKTPTQLANPMLSRTTIFYNNDIPFDIYAIGLLKNATVLTDAQREQLGNDFQLWLFYTEII